MLAACVGDTNPATNVQAHQATLNAHGHTNNGPAYWWWEYSPSQTTLENGQGTSTPHRGPASSATDVNLSEAVTGLTEQATYYFRACGQDQSSTSGSCGKTLSFTTLNAPPTAPGSLSADPGDGRVDLAWGESSDSDLAGYRVFRRNADGSWPTAATATTGASTTTYTDTPLTNGTAYTYRIVAFDAVGQTSAPSPEAAATPAADPVIAAAGDIACAPNDQYYNGGAGSTNNCRQSAVSDLLVGTGLTGVLPLGDEQYDAGQLSYFQQVYAPTWGRSDSIVHPALGNHEYLTSGASGYFDYFNGVGIQSGKAGDRSKGYYSYDIGSWHLIVLNSNCSFVACAAGSAQETWLKADLAAHSNACVLAYWHQPRFNSGTAGETTGTSPFWQDLYNASADLVLNGHQHSYERFAPQNASGTADSARGLREFIVGTGGQSHGTLGATKPNSEVRDIKTFGVLRIALHASSYDWRFAPAAVTGNGTLADSGTQACH